MSHVYLVADTRERYVQPFIDEAFGAAKVPFVVAQINTADFLVCRRSGGEESEVLAAIERKSLKDFAASIKDNRYANRKKMLALSARSGCQLYFFVEGAAFPAPTTKFSRVPFASIDAACTNLMIHDGIAVVKTKDERHTARRLLAFVRSFAALAGGDPPPLRGVRPAPAAGGDGGDDNVAACVIPPDLLGLVERDDATLVVDMWACLLGISVVSAAVAAAAGTVADFAAGRVDVAALRMPTGRPLTKRGRASLAALARGGKKEAIRILAGVPGVSAAAAAQILANHTLAALLALPPAGLAAISLQQKNRTQALGPKRAERIHRLMGRAPGAAPGAAPTDNAAPTDGAAPTAKKKAAPKKKKAAAPKKKAATAEALFQLFDQA